jgi:hypothetical protein
MDLKECELPIVDEAAGAGEQADPAAAERPSCGPTAYVSNEEAALLQAMRGLRERGLELRRRLDVEADPGRRDALVHELDALRQERSRLAERREQAFLRKMVMLGHLPPNVLEEPGLL